jgi:hypothetical protein
MGDPLNIDLSIIVANNIQRMINPISLLSGLVS